jgi:uncharacterized protein (TIGR01777 family)
MKILVTGGTGFLGSYLVKSLSNEGHTLFILTRNPGKYNSSVENVSYHDYEQVSRLVDGSDAVINLAGHNLFDEKWTDHIKSEILKSRVNTTRSLVMAMKVAENKPKVFISASAVGYYGNRGNEVLTDESTPGSDFLASVCVQWEEEALKASKYGVRVIIPRLGILLEKDGGALEKMITPFKMFVGGPLGSGDQYFPWIHMEDTVNAINFALAHNELEGPINVTAPEPVTMSDFSKSLGTTLSRPSFFKVPEFALKALLGEASGALIASQRVVPNRLLEAGFEFNYPKVLPALKSIF